MTRRIRFRETKGDLRQETGDGRPKTKRRVDLSVGCFYSVGARVSYCVLSRKSYIMRHNLWLP